MKHIEFDEIAGGALKEQFARSFDKVLENLLNPNTPFKTPREINIKLKFTQSERRDDAKCTVIVTEKLACASPHRNRIRHRQGSERRIRLCGGIRQSDADARGRKHRSRNRHRYRRGARRSR